MKIRNFKEKIFKDNFLSESKEYSSFFYSTQSYKNVEDRLKKIKAFWKNE